jgi:hypothetical protein
MYMAVCIAGVERNFEETPIITSIVRLQGQPSNKNDSCEYQTHF